MTIREIPPALTETWVFIGFADEIKNESVQPVVFMDRALVLWRSKSGVISLQNAYCPHMGAHLGYGKIHEEALACLFHKRSFNTDGVCVGKGKNNKSYPISRLDNMVFAWFGESVPTWEMPNFLNGFPNHPASTWRIFKAKKMNYNFHPKDLLDNTVDAIHFKTFHKQCITHKPIEILEHSAFFFASKMVFLGSPQIKMSAEDMELELISESYGPCTLLVNSTVTVLKQKYFFKFLFLCSPVAKENTNYTLAICTMTHQRDITLARKIIEYLYNNYAFHMQVKEFRKESELIWKHKTYLADPDIFSHEYAMKLYSQWYEKFYDNIGLKNNILAPVTE